MKWRKAVTALGRFFSHPFCASQQPACLHRVFSANGHIVSPQRALLKSDKVNMLIFLHFNLKWTKMHITRRMLGQLHFFNFEGENRQAIIAVHLICLHMVVLLHAHCFTCVDFICAFDVLIQGTVYSNLHKENVYLSGLHVNLMCMLKKSNCIWCLLIFINKTYWNVFSVCISSFRVPQGSIIAPLFTCICSHVTAYTLRVYPPSYDVMYLLISLSRSLIV